MSLSSTYQKTVRKGPRFRRILGTIAILFCIYPNKLVQPRNPTKTPDFIGLFQLFFHIYPRRSKVTTPTGENIEILRILQTSQKPGKKPTKNQTPPKRDLIVINRLLSFTLQTDYLMENTKVL